jgi:amidase/aspartyl-tRNA(Asn)/glutamyl-tRNA(Gln) amidotransferase subunit A
MTDDLTACWQRIHRRETSCLAEFALTEEAAASDLGRDAFLHLDIATARATASAVDAQREHSLALPPLAGLAVSIKDLFDVCGQVTTAGSTVLASDPPAGADALAVARLRAAGAALIGRTHMTEFAFSGVGLNPHHPTPRNVPMARIDPSTPRIPGGSSSGAATSVASGAAWAALGSDTGGSIRIPAALQGLVGFKNTAALTSTCGAIPLSTTLDTACAITRSVRDAILLHEVLASRRIARGGRPLRAIRLGVADRLMQDSLEPAVAAAFDAALARLGRAGAHIERISLPALDALAPLQRHGGLAAAESWAWHRRRLAEREADYDPRVAWRIRRGEQFSAADYIDLLHLRRDWITHMKEQLHGFDAVVSPTVPLTAPPEQPLARDDEAFFATNALLLRNPSVVNLLDGCAISLPCHGPGAAPVGLMLWSWGGADDVLLDTALAVESALASAAAP